MTEEEKKAIELLKQPPDFSLRYYEREKAIDVVLNLIKKQQKEIKELKNNELDYTTIYITGEFDGEKKYKNKIREKIRELKNMTEGARTGIYAIQVDILEELLEEDKW